MLDVRHASMLLALVQAGCGSKGIHGDADADADSYVDTVAEEADVADVGDARDADAPEVTGPCPAGMAPVGDACMDLFEAPNVEGALPLVMYTFLEAEAWCASREKRLCTDVEWLEACEGPGGLAYPYGDDHVPGRCNDDETWRTYDQPLLNGWPASASGTGVGSLEALLEAARAVSAAAEASADHVESLYQGEGSGTNGGCAGDAGVFDLVGNVEEWTRRADGGEPSFHGNLKGRYWAESRTCQGSVLVHGDGFRFYEIGFRCCADMP